jgi:hypothetical protein
MGSWPSINIKFVPFALQIRKVEHRPIVHITGPAPKTDDYVLLAEFIGGKYPLPLVRNYGKYMMMPSDLP